jgi:8-oxo-dGTP pyrophosphatase MutT (NUDIX family)
MPDLVHARPSTIRDAAWRTAYLLGFPLARIWWHLRRERHEGALVAVHVGSALLLVRSSYLIAWNFPGGIIRRGETPEMAARRELTEEIGLVG